MIEGVNPGDASSVVWSPDPRTLAVVEQKENWHVVTVDVASGKVRPAGRGLSVSYSREGELLVVRGRGFDELWSSENGRPQRRLFRMPDRQHLLSVDAD